ncbi:MAG: DNA polymerase III subunit gamma/tau [Acidobacteria bacterium]|nr:DNA polymerase III subunit gamma/tau [Acidobacteriota bacterium]
MSHIALARKWRPQRFEDVIGQRGVVETLRNAIASGRLAQSFVFAGPRGVGKTTTARILARALNCVTGPTADPCGECDACREIAEGRDVDVMEIDGATYTGIDAVREVIVEPLSIAPMRNRYKIFIIDEVHRLSKSAFDALLKSIEEPPPYVKFMMATTELDAVPDTILSRSQVFELKALPFASIRDQLRGVTTNEGVTIDDAALALVARSAEGSMRDALSALDQVLAFTSQNVTAADVSTVLGLVGRDVQFDVAETVAREDAGAVFALAGGILESGFDLRTVCRELARLVRDLMVTKIDPTRLADPEIASEGERDRMQALAERYSHADLMRAFDLLAMAERDIRTSSQPRHTFEMALLKWIHLRKMTPIEELLAGGVAPTRSVPSVRPVRPVPSVPSVPSVQPVQPVQPVPSVPSVPSVPQSIKSNLLASIREANKSFFGMVIAQVQTVEVEGDRITFSFAPAHKNLRGQLEAKRAWIENLAHNLTGRKMTVAVKEAEGSAVVPTAKAPTAAAVDPAKQADLRARAKAEPAVQNVLDVFGGEIEDVEETQ